MLMSEVKNGMKISKQVYSPIIILILTIKLCNSNFVYGSSRGCLVEKFCKTSQNVCLQEVIDEVITLIWRILQISKVFWPIILNTRPIISSLDNLVVGRLSPITTLFSPISWKFMLWDAMLGSLVVGLLMDVKSYFPFVWKLTLFILLLLGVLIFSLEQSRL